MNIRLMLDSKKFSTKPTKDQVGMIVNRIMQHPESATLEQLAIAITEGRTHTPATFEPPNGLYGAARKNNECWFSQQIFELDFDAGMSSQQFMLLCNEYSIQPSIVYHTFSSNPEQEKFRAIFTLDQPVTDYRARGVIQLALMRLFPQCDSACSDAARHFYGGPDIVVSDYTARMNVHALIQAYCFSEYQRGNPERSILSFCQQTGLSILNNSPDISLLVEDEIEEKTASSNIYYYRACGEILKFVFSVDEATMKCTPKKAGKILHKHTVTSTKVRHYHRRGFDFDALFNACLEFREFQEGTRRLTHHERFGIITNLSNVEGGRTEFAEGLASREDYNYDKGLYEFNYADKHGYGPLACDNFCPYVQTCTHNKIMLQQTNIKRSEVRRLFDMPLKALSEAEEELQQKFDDCISSTDNRVYVIKAPTGIGKTRLYTSCNLNNVVIVVPTHKLRKEVAQKLLENGVEFCTIPDRPVLDDDEKERLIQGYTKINAYSEANKVFEGYVSRALYLASKNEALSACQQAAIVYQEAMDIIRSDSASTILCTHDKLPYINSRRIKTVIVDEDILKTAVLKGGRVQLQDFHRLLSYITINTELNNSQRNKLSEQVQAVIKDLTEATPHCVTKTGTYSFDTKLLVQILKNNIDCLESNIIEFLDANCYFIKSSDGNQFEYKINKVNKLFRQDKKYIILSATCSKPLYQALLKERAEFHDLGQVELTGRIEQYVKTNYSRSSIADAPDKSFAEISKKVGSLPTFFYKKMSTDNDYKKMAEKYKLNIVGYFGNTAGYDGFKGQDIAVVGTPHVTNNEYLLTAACLGYMAGITDQTAEYRPVIRNGYEFWFNTFDNELIREIQLWEIETELIQAIGRARAIREDCSVLVLSNYPIPGARIKELGE